MIDNINFPSYFYFLVKLSRFQIEIRYHATLLFSDSIIMMENVSESYSESGFMAHPEDKLWLTGKLIEVEKC